MALLLLDSASLYYRSYYALPETLTAPDGMPVNAVRGLLDTTAAMVSARSSDRVIACWDDDWRPQWRVDLVPSYKAHRVAQATDADDAPVDEAAFDEEVPDTLAPQVDLLRELLPLFGIPVVGEHDLEADDVIASLASTHAADVDVASGDRDLVQLVSERVTMLFTGGTATSRGGKPWVSLDPSAAHERFGVPPGLYADLAILRGDPSDGLPGAPGIGDKTARALVEAFGGLDTILAAAHDPSTAKPMTPAVRRRLLESRDSLLAAERVVRLEPPRGSVRMPPSTALDPERALRAAERWGVAAPARRRIDARQAGAG